MKFEIGDKVKIREKPTRWASLLGEEPFSLCYPKEFVISSIKKESSYTAMGTKDGYGFSLSYLIEENNIELLVSSKPEIIDNLISCGFTDKKHKLTKDGKEALRYILKKLKTKHKFEVGE